MDFTYLDYNASAPLPYKLLAEVEKTIQCSSSNPSSLHKLGRQSRRLINDATEIIAKFIECDPQFIYWTSGATEANSWAIYSAVQYAKYLGKSEVKILISSLEHESTLMAAQALSAHYKITLDSIPALPNGEIDLNFLQQSLKQTSSQPYDLVSVMAVNNETGVIQPIEQVIQLCAQYGAPAAGVPSARLPSTGLPFHIDCAQALGKVDLKINQLIQPNQIGYFTFSGHKLGALKGIGFLAVVGEGRLLWPIVHGKQQKQLRGGTENPLLVHILGKVIEALSNNEAGFPEQLLQYRNQFEFELKRRIERLHIHGQDSKRIRNTSYIGFDGVDGDTILVNLDLEGICASSGSACTSGSIDPSHVLLAMGINKSMARSSIRLSSGFETTWSDYEKVLNVLPDIVRRVRGY